MNRQRASTALAIVGSALALIGGVALYLHFEIFEADHFADNAAQVLQDEDAREALTEPIVDQAVTSGPDQLINGQPLLRTAVSGVLESSPFAKLFRGGVAKVHRGLFAKDREEIPLTLNNIDILVADAVTNFNPKLGKKVPRNLGNKVVQVTDNPTVLSVVRLSEELKVLGLILPFGAVLCIGGAFALAPDRRRILMVTGVALAVAAAIGLVALLIGRNLVLARFDGDDSVYAAVDATWEAMLGALRTWMIAAGAIALIVTAAASTARELDPSAPARRALAFVAASPEKAGWVLVRAGLIAAVSIWVVFDALEALKVVAVVAGGYGIFYAACEALALIAPAPGDRRRKVQRSPRALAIGGAALVAGVIAVAVLLNVLGDDDEKRVATRPAGPTERCNGFAELCDKPFNEVALPGAHNAMSAARLPGWFTPNQRNGIQQQLDDGIRALLIDTHYGIGRKKGPVLTDFSKEDRSKVLESVESELGPSAVPAFQSITAQIANSGGEGKPGPYLCHVVCELGSIELVRALGWVRDFLDTHPDEVVMLFVEDKVSPEDTATAFKASGILRYAYEHPAGEPYPTLREMIESNKRLFVMAEEDNGGGEYPWYHDGFELAQETPYTFGAPAELAAKASCDPNRGGTEPLLFQLNHWIEKVPRSPKTAAIVNNPKFIVPRARFCEKVRDRIPNIIGVDYYDQGDVFAATQRLNGIPDSEEPRFRETD